MLKTFLLLALITWACFVHAQGSFPEVPQIQQAQTLLESDKPREAYELLQPLELEQAGNILFDYLLGISALDSGKASQAVFALERVQESDPGYGDIGLWLSIAYYRSGDRERAQASFESVLTHSQNPRSKSSAHEYLAALKQLDAAEDLRKKEATSPYLLGKWEAGFGYDSNISNNNPGSAQASNTLTTPTSNFEGMESILNFGMEGRIPISGNYVFVSAEDGLRKYHGHGIMNSETLIAKGGMNITSDHGDVYRIALARRLFRQQGNAEEVKDNDNDYNINGLETNAKFKLSEQAYIGVIAQYNQLRILTNILEDTNQVILGANYMYIFHVSGNPVFYFGYTRTADKAVQMKAAYEPTYNNGLTVASRNSNNYAFYFQYSITNNMDIFSANYVNFRRDTGAFSRDRFVAFGDDRTRYFSIGLNWRPWSLWTVALQVASTSNDSDISLYSYDKTESRITLKRDFNSL